MQSGDLSVWPALALGISRREVKRIARSGIIKADLPAFGPCRVSYRDLAKLCVGAFRAQVACRLEIEVPALHGDKEHSNATSAEDTAHLTSALWKRHGIHMIAQNTPDNIEHLFNAKPWDPFAGMIWNEISSPLSVVAECVVNLVLLAMARGGRTDLAGDALSLEGQLLALRRFFNAPLHATSGRDHESVVLSGTKGHLVDVGIEWDDDARPPTMAVVAQLRHGGKG